MGLAEDVRARGEQTVSATKRYLEDQTDSVLDSVRLYGSAVIVEARESDRYGWGGGPYALL